MGVVVLENNQPLYQYRYPILALTPKPADTPFWYHYWSIPIIQQHEQHRGEFRATLEVGLYESVQTAALQNNSFKVTEA